MEGNNIDQIEINTIEKIEKQKKLKNQRIGIFERPTKLTISEKKKSTLKIRNVRYYIS